MKSLIPLLIVTVSLLSSLPAAQALQPAAMPLLAKPMTRSSATYDRLAAVANDLAMIWGDTILEGDFYADDLVTLEKVQRLSDSTGTAYYRITYSSKAWDLTTCHFDSKDLATLSDCTEGRIVEVGFVSLDFTEFAQDRKNPAHFVANKLAQK